MNHRLEPVGLQPPDGLAVAPRNGLIARRRWRALAFAGLLLAVAGCSRPAAEAPVAAEPVPRVAVVATFTILADLVANVGGDRVAVSSLVGPDGDAHVFSPSPAHARALADARLVVVNGLGFEGWIERLIEASGYRGPVAVASEGIDALPLAPAAHGHGHGHVHGQGHGAAAAVDPHGWQSPAQVRRYVANLAAALSRVDPHNAGYYRERAATYDARIEALDREARERFARIDPDRRRVITGHDAFGHLGAAYGIRFFSPRGVSTGGEASARDVARLVRQIREQRIQAVFVENISDPRLIEQLARESGARVGGLLFSDALSDKDARASSYLAMMRHNIDTIANALAGDPVAP